MGGGGHYRFSHCLRVLFVCLLQYFLLFRKNYVVSPPKKILPRTCTSANNAVVKSFSGCVRTLCFQLLSLVWNKLLSPCYKVDDGGRLAIKLF